VTYFVDTSAFYAVLDHDDANHPSARPEWESLLKGGAVLLTTNYVLLETLALLQHRLGIDAVRTFHEVIYPLLRVEWVDVSLHDASVDGTLSASRRDLSLVDCTSFSVMRRLGVRHAFAFDRHFVEQGFSCVPA